MSEEIKNEEKCEHKCICQNETFRKILTIALGTFIGVYGALSLFAATHRPPMMPPCARGFGFGAPAPMAAPCPFIRHKHHFHNGFHGVKETHQKLNEQNGPALFDADRNKN